MKLFVFEFAFKISEGIEDERDQAARDQRDFEWTCAQARRLEDELDREERELADRAAQAEEAEQAKIEAVIDRLPEAGARTRAKVESCAGGGGGLPEDFRTSWAHGMGKSRICVYVTGRDGQTGDVTVNGTAEPNPVKTFTLDAQGRATVTYEISVPGPYGVSVRWSQANGTSTVRNGSVNVTGGPPADPTPTGFSPCPAP